MIPEVDETSVNEIELADEQPAEISENQDKQKAFEEIEGMVTPFLS